MTDASASRSRFMVKGWHVLVAFIVFFGGDIAVNAVFMIQAYRTFPGETSMTPYEDGVAFNAQLQRRRVQSTLGWRFTVGAETPDGLRVEAFDRAGAPLVRLHVTARLRRPATDAGERVVSFAESTPGVYLARSQRLPGAWDIEVTARDRRGVTATAGRRLYQP